MPMHRKNKGTAVRADSEHEAWFTANRRMNRRRWAAAKIAKRIQRRK